MVRKPKSFGEYTNKDWQKLIRYLAFFGVFMAILGIYLKNLDIIWLGMILTLIPIVSGFVLQFFFGVKIIDLRRDFKNKKF